MNRIGQAMSNPTLDQAINELVAIEVHGWTRHLSDTKPYLSPKTYPEWAHIQQTARISHDHEQRLAGLIQELGVSLCPSTYESNVAHYHYIDLQAILGMLIQEKRRQIAGYERAISHAGDNAAAVEVLQDLLGDVQGQYELLKASLARVSS